MRDSAETVIIGAGIVGCSAALHLTELGCKDVLVIEQGPLFTTGGSTSHAPGLIFQLNSSRLVCALARHSVELYGSLSREGEPCFLPVGSMEVATTAERWSDLKRKAGWAKAWGLEAHLISAEEAARLVPLLQAERILGAIHVPSDGIAGGVPVSEAMARAAMARGAEFVGDTQVTGIEVTGGRVRAVLTARGRIAAERVLVCAGIWGPAVGRMAEVSIPLTPVQHQYARTTPLPELAGETGVRHPILRHQDRAMYFRQQGECYGIGSYRHEPLLVDVDRIPRHGEAPVTPSMLPFTPEHFAPALEAAGDLLPALRGATLAHAFNGMFSFTPDGQSLLGESMEVRSFWVAEAVWVTHGGGVGKLIAEWMVEGLPSMDAREVDLNRFHGHVATPTYIRTRGAQQYREVYDIIHPLQQLANPRGLRRGPFHQREEGLGAVFFESAGWERPQWYQVNERLLADLRQPARQGWTAEYWSPIAAAEHQAARERVALFDLTAFTKLEVSGPGALAYLERLAANKVDSPIGKVTYTALLNERGGIQCDLTVARLAEDRFWVLTGGSVGMHDLAWMRRHLPEDSSTQITNQSSAYCCVGLWGPRAREVLSRICEDDLDNAAFPYFTARHISCGPVPVLALRVSYVGELGWELYASTEYGLYLWDMLWEAGQSLGITAAGGAAFESLRLEKGYRFWSQDIHADYTPLEAGLGFAVRPAKGNFLGRAALLRQKEAGVSRKLCALTLDDPDRVVMGKEPILDGERILGYVTSAGYGYTIGRGIAYGYLPISHAAQGTAVQIEFFGEPLAATVTREPLYDPEGLRLKS
jgi:glycine cleavage system aminomethyltransferase T/glycine/D-amino acid oxidase-like deaminating enzyme